MLYYTGQAASASASVSLATNDFGYFLFRHASAILADTERDDLLI